MQSCEHDHYKQDGQKRGQRGLFGAAAVLIFLSVVGAFWRRKPRRRGVLSVRSALILTLSTIAALGGGWLLYLRPQHRRADRVQRGRRVRARRCFL